MNVVAGVTNNTLAATSCVLERYPTIPTDAPVEYTMVPPIIALVNTPPVPVIVVPACDARPPATTGDE